MQREGSDFPWCTFRSVCIGHNSRNDSRRKIQVQRTHFIPKKINPHLLRMRKKIESTRISRSLSTKKKLNASTTGGAGRPLPGGNNGVYISIHIFSFLNLITRQKHGWILIFCREKNSQCRCSRLGWKINRSSPSTSGGG